MTVAETSRDAFEGIKQSLGNKQQIVYDTIKEMGTATNEMLSDELNWPINQVTPRVNELCRFEMVAVIGLHPNRSGVSAKLFAVADINDRKLKEITNDCAA